jgi:membrane protein implicated in regulation of membrane protease activity
MDLLQWWNLIFLLPAVAALLYLLLLSLGAIPAEGHDFDAGDAGHLELHGHLDHPDGDPFHGALSLIGVGRIPLSLILMSFAFLWGFFGWLGTQIFATFLTTPELFVWPSLVVALVGASVFTRVLAFGLGRLMPGTESYGAEARELIGRMADVRYPLTEKTGTVQLHDQHGSIHEVPARVLPGEAAIPAGTRVVLWRFNEQEGSYFAVQDDALSEIVSRHS